MDAAHSAAWMEALDGLSLVVGSADVSSGGERGTVGGATVEAATEVTPAPYVPPPTPYAVLDTSVQLTEARFEELLAQAGFDRATWPAAKVVAWCESRWSPNATGGAGERGTFQVHPIHRDSTYDELGNFLAAYRISSGGYDWTAWSCRPG